MERNRMKRGISKMIPNARSIWAQKSRYSSIMMVGVMVIVCSPTVPDMLRK